MALKLISDRPVGVLGAGSFGTVIANLLAINQPVMLYSRRQEMVDAILATRTYNGREVHPNVQPTTDAAAVLANCLLVFPTVPSAFMRDLIQELSGSLRSDHILIHATKGLDVRGGRDLLNNPHHVFQRKDIRTMSEVILEESVVLRVGALAGPNLAGEIIIGKPAATVIASTFDEVIDMGRKALRSANFQVYGNHDITGVELSGVLKNAIAIGAGVLTGLEMGENARALLITKGLGEMIRLGQAMGSDTSAFFGLAGIGDLIATCNSPLSRNHTVGYRLAMGETLDNILASSQEVAEGINTIRIARHLGQQYDIRLPIINTLHAVLFEGFHPKDALSRLMSFSYGKDVDFL